MNAELHQGCLRCAGVVTVRPEGARFLLLRIYMRDGVGCGEIFVQSSIGIVYVFQGALKNSIGTYVGFYVEDSSCVGLGVMVGEGLGRGAWSLRAESL